MPWRPDRPFRILSIDGGGIRGILPAALLAKVENELTPNSSIASRFDLIAGTSTGGIIAIGLALGLKAQDILDLYMKEGSRIFSSAPPPWRWLGRQAASLKQIVWRRYNPTILDRALAARLGGRRFGDATCRLVIPALDHNTEPYIFKTPHHPDYKKDWSDDAIVVARATSAAPTFLEGLEDAGRRFWDGGVFANNPVMMALVDTLACYDVDRRNIEILSLGCSTQIPALSKRHLKAGMWGWRGAHAVASSLQCHDALGQAGLLIGRDRVTRIDAALPSPIAMDDYHSASSILPGVANRLFYENLHAIKPFLSHEAEPYFHFHGTSPTRASGHGGAA